MDAVCWNESAENIYWIAEMWRARKFMSYNVSWHCFSLIHSKNFTDLLALWSVTTVVNLKKAKCKIEKGEKHNAVNSFKLSDFNRWKNMNTTTDLTPTTTIKMIIIVIVVYATVFTQIHIFLVNFFKVSMYIFHIHRLDKV